MLKDLMNVGNMMFSVISVLLFITCPIVGFSVILPSESVS